MALMKTQLRKAKAPEPVEAPPVRTIEMINQEYANLCAELGDLTVRHEGRSAFLKGKLTLLRQEADNLTAQGGA